MTTGAAKAEACTVMKREIFDGGNIIIKSKKHNNNTANTKYNVDENELTARLSHY